MEPVNWELKLPAYQLLCNSNTPLQTINTKLLPVWWLSQNISAMGEVLQTIYFWQSSFQHKSSIIPIVRTFGCIMTYMYMSVYKYNQLHFLFKDQKAIFFLSGFQKLFFIMLDVPLSDN